jgi:hypothetical protein
MPADDFLDNAPRSGVTIDENNWVLYRGRSYLCVSVYLPIKVTNYESYSN